MITSFRERIIARAIAINWRCSLVRFLTFSRSELTCKSNWSRTCLASRSIRCRLVILSQPAIEGHPISFPRKILLVISNRCASSGF